MRFLFIKANMSLLQLRVKSDMFANNFLRHYGQFKYDLQGFSWKIMKLAHETFFSIMGISHLCKLQHF